eukprot:CAMPEP_0173385872 /NCGR_PEP_ID=MMETSP1356-20130122/8470_1 /TAXON_ID=77927 ORGANISM="Hemiselmis virescens, Strain PCC157" /NCGR_SAMPLE_ID=MMETSP1356 /ASSEMBLY_ACC=CAM_ASM_000847 /LENGTH=299 /DNA_ID=CAMNT_0014341869 /DNA_START=58 /DNA_END=957 /DNA_ORIENTATION=-
MAAVPEDREHKDNMLFGIPKKGRLHQKCMELIAGAGLDHTRPDRVDVAHCNHMPVTLVFLPAADIATYVGEGNVDMGITGLDVIDETIPPEEVVREVDLGFGRCKLSVQAPVRSNITKVSDLAGKRIVTSFPNLAKRFFAKYETAATGATKIKFVSGSVEAACGLGLADAVVDLVETGTTMRAAGLDVVEDIMQTESVLISNPNSTHKEMLATIKQRILGYLTATKYSMIQYNVHNTNLTAACAVTPGKRSCTVSHLAQEGWCSVSALVLRKDQAMIMDKLEKVGADSILIFKIDNSRM